VRCSAQLQGGVLVLVGKVVLGPADTAVEFLFLKRGQLFWFSLERNKRTN